MKGHVLICSCAVPSFRKSSLLETFELAKSTKFRIMMGILIANTKFRITIKELAGNKLSPIWMDQITMCAIMNF